MGILKLLNKKSDVPELLKNDFSETRKIVEDFLYWLKFSVGDTSRDPLYSKNNILYYLEQDMIETLIIVLSNIQDGAHNPAKRETRFLLELSIKMAYVQQKAYDKKVEEKIKLYTKQIRSTNIGIKNQIMFSYLSAESKSNFLNDVGKIYSEASLFVHLTVENMTQRIQKVTDGNYIGYESIEELKATNVFLKKIISYCMIFIIESLPDYVVGDWFGMLYPETKSWYFLKSKYVSEIDMTFDYKEERKRYLGKIIEERANNIEF